jgi:hypothetical protein
MFSLIQQQQFTMALRKLLSNAILPNMERDLSRSMAAELATVAPMVDNMLAPQAFAYCAAGNLSAGAFQKSAARSAPVSDRLVKVHFPAKPEGVFKDQENWHGRFY